MATEYAAPPVPARLDQHEQARQDRLVRAEIDRERDAARVQATVPATSVSTNPATMIATRA